MSTVRRKRHVRSILMLSIFLCGCSPKFEYTLSVLQLGSLVTDPLLLDFAPVHDPSIMLQNGIYYLFSSDPDVPAADGHLPIRCSPDQVSWRLCGYVFAGIPGWVKARVAGVQTLWAPDISYFSGSYHLYYAGSTLGSQTSVIGLATNTTLDSTDPDYHWLDRGVVLSSEPGDDFNAIDPNILIDADHRAWLTYGSYWSGIKQREIDRTTGMLLGSNATRYELATRPGVRDDAIEGSSLVHHGSFYYLFLSVDHCCETSPSQDNYKQVVGRSASPNGPFVDARGIALMQGGGSILLEGNSAWLAPGGGTAYVDPESGASLLVFHALEVSHAARPTLWVKAITWTDDWPVLH